MSELKIGLEGVVVAQQDVSFINGETGELVYRGYHIDELAPSATFEEIVYLLWHGKLPNKQEVDGLKERLVACRDLNDSQMKFLKSVPHYARPMSVCRTGVSQIALYDTSYQTLEVYEKSTNLARANNILAQAPTIMAAFSCLRRGFKPIPPREDLDHAANFLWMLNGKDPSEEAVRALDLYFVLLAEHGFNASTFSCRVTAATWANMYASVVSGIATLGGHAHGGAVQAAMNQFQEIGNINNVEPWFYGAMETKKRIMGIGHRVYKALDPRAPHLRAKAQSLAEKSDHRKWFDIAVKLEELAAQHPYFQERKLFPNVDFYSAPLLYMLNLQPDMFTPMFALSRIAGWCAHIMGQYENNRLIRPRAEYIGPKGFKWTPIEERGDFAADTTM